MSEKQEPLPHLVWTTAQTPVIGVAFPAFSWIDVIFSFWLEVEEEVASMEVIQHQTWWSDNSECQESKPWYLITFQGILSLFFGGFSCTFTSLVPLSTSAGNR